MTVGWFPTSTALLLATTLPRTGPARSLLGLWLPSTVLSALSPLLCRLVATLLTALRWLTSPGGWLLVRRLAPALAGLASLRLSATALRWLTLVAPGLLMGWPGLGLLSPASVRWLLCRRGVRPGGRAGRFAGPG